MHQRTAGKADTDLGQRIRLRRVEIGMSQDALAKQLGLSFQQVQKYEKGTNRVGAARLESIAKGLGVPITYFYDNQSKSQSEVESLLFLDSNFSLRLLRAYTSIQNQRVQRGLVKLLEDIAGIG